MTSGGFTLENAPLDIGLRDIDTVFVPGRFRSPDGMDLSPFSLARVEHAAHFYHTIGHAPTIIAAGYRNPADPNGQPWQDEAGETFIGRPEAYSMRAHLLDRGVAPEHIKVEPHSFDSVTNLTNARELIADDAIVAVAAQQKHLARILRCIVPKVWDVRCVGLVVPELPDNPDHDGLSGELFSNFITRGLTPNTPHLREIASERVRRTWRTLVPLRMKTLGRVAAKEELRRLSA